jgi:hypothetical protein
MDRPAVAVFKQLVSLETGLRAIINTKHQFKRNQHFHSSRSIHIYISNQPVLFIFFADDQRNGVKCSHHLEQVLRRVYRTANAKSKSKAWTTLRVLKQL